MKNFDKKYDKKNRPNNILEVPLCTNNLTEDALANILDILASTSFSKISFPISAYKWQIDSSVDRDDNRSITAGYIKKYDAETKTFTIVIYNKLAETIMAFKEPVMDVVFTEYKGKFGTITRLIVADDAMGADASDDSDEAAAE